MNPIQKDIRVGVDLMVSVACHSCGNFLTIESTRTHKVTLHIVVGTCKRCRTRTAISPEEKE